MTHKEEYDGKVLVMVSVQVAQGIDKVGIDTADSERDLRKV